MLSKSYVKISFQAFVEVPTWNNPPEGIEDGDVVEVVHLDDVTILLDLLRQEVGELLDLVVDDGLHSGLAEAELSQRPQGKSGSKSCCVLNLEKIVALLIQRGSFFHLRLN